MPNDHSSQTKKLPAEKDSQVVDMAARLFAELFYKQVMAEREEKVRRARKGQFDGPPREDLQST